MATVPRQKQQREGAAAVLRGVSFKAYERLLRHPANRSLRMAYFDGTLEIMSPINKEHEENSRGISIVITTVGDVLGLDYHGVGSTTVRKRGDGPLKGVGREPDQSFFLQNVDRRPGKGPVPDLADGGLPPDLWVEVDNRVSSRARLPTYARLGIPEVWQYRVETNKIRFLQLDGDQYRPLERSLALPVLTPALVAAALKQGEGMIESAWVRWLRGWAEQFRAEEA